MFGKLDRYISRSFLEPFLLATAVVVGLYVVADVFGNIDDYIIHAGSLTEAARRIVHINVLRLPSFLAPVLPIAMLFGTAYGLSQLSGNNEITAMKASGLSFWRILTPIYFMAVIVALMGFANNELLVPVVEQRATPLESQWLGKTKRVEQRVMVYVEREQTFFIVNNYNTHTRKASNVTIVRNDGDKPFTLTAARAEPAKGGWNLFDVRTTDSEEMESQRHWPTSLKTRDIGIQLLPPEMLPLRALRRLMRDAESPEDRRKLLLNYYRRFAYPLTGIVLVALGVPFVIGHERIQRSRMLGIGVCVVIAMIFYSVQFISSSLGQDGYLPPALAAFLPIAIFGGVGLYLLETVHA